MRQVTGAPGIAAAAFLLGTPIARFCPDNEWCCAESLDVRPSETGAHMWGRPWAIRLLSVIGDT
jgi:hypothetical protein